MTKLEKVIKGLECCMSNCVDCNNCPYDYCEDCQNGYEGCMKDALELLKNQKAVIDKVRKAYESTVVEDE